jgi:hypothetical protein
VLTPASLQCETDRVNWRAYALRTLIAHSGRWWWRSGPPLTRRNVTAVALVAPLLALAVVMIEVVWLVTGRARRVRHALGYDEIVVTPGARGIPERRKREWEEIAAHNRERVERMQADIERRGTERAS